MIVAVTLWIVAALLPSGEVGTAAFTEQAECEAVVEQARARAVAVSDCVKVTFNVRRPQA